MNQKLTPRQVLGLEHLGDILIPGDAEYPSFSSSGQMQHIDRILDYLPEKDVADLKGLLAVLSYFPLPLLKGFWKLVDSSYSWPDRFGAVFRFIRIGVRGLVFSLYYSDGPALDRIGYKVSVYTEDLKG